MRSLLLALVLAAATACSNDSKPAEVAATGEFPTMSIDEVEKAVLADQATAVDCNGDRTRKKLGVVPNAILVSDEEAFAASELPADKSRKLIFYCSDAG